MSEPNYASGDEYVVEFLGYRFGFNAEDFEERITAAAVRLGLIGSNDLDEDETADLVELAADGRIADARSPLGRYLVRHWERVGLLDGESLVYWLRKLVFRGAWLDHRVKEGLLEVAWDEESGDFGYAEPRAGARCWSSRRCPPGTSSSSAVDAHARNPVVHRRRARRGHAGRRAGPAAARPRRLDRARARPSRPSSPPPRPDARRRRGRHLRRDRRLDHLGRLHLPAREPALVRAAQPRPRLPRRRLARRLGGAAEAVARARRARGSRRLGIAGVTVLPRADVGGAIGAALLAVYLVRGRAPEIYAGVFLVVAWLELYGTAIGTWEWAVTIPGTSVPQGNPPSGVASGYVWFDIVALALAPVLIRSAARIRSGSRALPDSA